MKFRFLLAATLSIIAAGVICSDIAQAEPEICERLKEISSLGPHKTPIHPEMPLEEQCRFYYWSELRPLPLSKVLNGAERAQYDEAIATRDCGTAEALLSKRFVEAHPDIPSILETESDYSVWKLMMVGQHFPTLGLCFDLEMMRTAQREIDRLGLAAAPYAGRRKSLYPPSLERLPRAVIERHAAISKMQLNLGFSSSPDIALPLLKLSVEGKALKYHAWYELYWAYWLRDRGQKDPIIQQVINRPLDNWRKADIERRAKLGYSQKIPRYPDEQP